MAIASDFKCALLGIDRIPRWDDFVKDSPQGTVFQTKAYLQCVQRGFQRNVSALGVFRGNKIVGGVVLFPRKKYGFSYTTAPYYVPYNGLMLAAFSESPYYFKRNQLQNLVMERLLGELEARFAYCDFYHSPQLEDLRPFLWRNWRIQPQYSIIVPLQEGKDFSSRMEGAQRRRLRQIEKRGCEVNPGTDTALLYQFMEQSYHYHGMIPPLNRQVFLEFTTALLQAGIGKLYLANLDTRPLAAVMVVEDPPNVYALFSGRNFKEDSSGVELFLLYKIMQTYQENRYEKLDLLGAMIPSITKVKLELGGFLQRFDQTIYYRNSMIKSIVNWQQKRFQKRRRV
ncbi:MAG: hypothetical protein Kow0042_21890 [Calditrichia bacterium]